MDPAGIKQHWRCFADAMHKINNPRCPDTDEWGFEHTVGELMSSFDNAQHTGQPTWYLYGKVFRKIASLGIDNQPVKKNVSPPASKGPQIGETVRLLFGQLKVIETALTPAAYGDFTKCLDGPGSISCVTKLVDSQIIFLVPRGTRAQILSSQDNPYHAVLLAGRLVQIRILEGTYQGRAMWLLEERITR